MAYMSVQSMTIKKHADAVRRMYAEYSKKLVALQKSHHEETALLLRELEQRKIEELRKFLRQS